MPFSASQISPCTPKTLRSFSLHATSLVRLISFSLFYFVLCCLSVSLSSRLSFLGLFLSFLTLSLTHTNMFLLLDMYINICVQ